MSSMKLIRGSAALHAMNNTESDGVRTVYVAKISMMMHTEFSRKSLNFFYFVIIAGLKTAHCLLA